MKLAGRFTRLSLLALLALVLLTCWAGPSSAAATARGSIPAAAEAALDTPGSAGFVPGRVLVKSRGEARDLISSLSSDYPVTLEGSVAELGVLRLTVPAGREWEAARDLQRSPLVEWAEPDHLRGLLATVPNDQLYQQSQWNLRKIQAEQAWDITTGSQDVIVAVLDTGIDRGHPDLAGKLLPGYDFLNDGPEPSDDSGHGTHKAGVIGAASNNGVGIAGVAWGSRIMPLKVLNSSGIGPDSVIARGIRYAVDHGARIINMSFGSSNSSRVLATAVQYAADRGVLVVAAAGNTAKMDNASIYPAAYDSVLAVAATDKSDNVADFSQHRPYVGVSAPGVRIVGPFWRGAGYSSYVESSGTSDAAPHVSGLAALIWSANPNLTVVQVKQAIQDTADDLGPPGWDEYYGAGRINAHRALLAVKPPAPPVATATPILPVPTLPVSTLAAPTLPAPTPAAPPPTPVPVATPATVPRAVWYFAEGSTARPFDLWLLLQNPNSTATTARVTYLRADGSPRQSQEVWLPPVSRRSILVNQVVPNAEVSMKVESDALIFAERAMYFGADGHGSAGVPAPSTRWYMAEGSTRSGFDTWILLQNPADAPASVAITLMTSEGERKEFSLGMPPASRRSLYLNEILPDVEVSAVVASDQPIIAERSTYFRGTGGHGGVLSSQLSRTWYLAEGRAGEGFDSWLLVLNPNSAVANLRVTYMREDGSTNIGYYAVKPGSRLSIHANEAVAAGRFGARVDADQPIAVERSTYFAGGAGGHSVAGTPLLSREWYLPEGSTRPPFTEEIALLNPNDHVANLVVTFMRVDGTTETRDFAANPTSRLTLRVNDLVPGAEASVRVTSDAPIAVERSMYFNGGLGATSALGIPR